LKNDDSNTEKAPLVKQIITRIRMIYDMRGYNDTYKWYIFVPVGDAFLYDPAVQYNPEYLLQLTTEE
jgi:hypothetical protein